VNARMQIGGSQTYLIRRGVWSEMSSNKLARQMSGR
jgi:hypothetical protein